MRNGYLNEPRLARARRVALSDGLDGVPRLAVGQDVLLAVGALLDGQGHVVLEQVAVALGVQAAAVVLAAQQTGVAGGLWAVQRARVLLEPVLLTYVTTTTGAVH